MYTVNGFIEIADWVDNTTATVAPVGELSPIARTYAQDKGRYASESYEGYELITFISRDQDDQYVTLPQVAVDAVFDVVLYLQNLADAGILPLTAAQLKLDLINRYTNGYSNFALSEVVATGIGQQRFINRLSFNFTSLTGQSFAFALWFSNAEFIATFPAFLTAVIPPDEDLNTFYLKMAGYTADTFTAAPLVDVLMAIRLTRAQYPETLLTTREYTAHFFNLTLVEQPLVNFATTWTILVWGTQSPAESTIRAALQNYILDNSDYTRSQWAKVFPELFNAQEFIVIPDWDIYAIPNQEVEAGLYSPAVNYHQINRMVREGLPDDYNAHLSDVQKNLELTTFIYKSLSLAVIGGLDNAIGMTLLSAVFPDYVLVDSLDPRFARMAPRTQAFVLLLEAAIMEAEGLTPYNQLDVRFSREFRDGRYYVTFDYEELHYLVLAKRSMHVQDMDNHLLLDTALHTYVNPHEEAIEVPPEPVPDPVYTFLESKTVASDEKGIVFIDDDGYIKPFAEDYNVRAQDAVLGWGRVPAMISASCTGNLVLVLDTAGEVTFLGTSGQFNVNDYRLERFKNVAYVNASFYDAALMVFLDGTVHAIGADWYGEISGVNNAGITDAIAICGGFFHTTVLHEGGTCSTYGIVSEAYLAREAEVTGVVKLYRSDTFSIYQYSDNSIEFNSIYDTISPTSAYALMSDTDRQNVRGYAIAASVHIIMYLDGTVKAFVAAGSDDYDIAADINAAGIMDAVEVAGGRRNAMIRHASGAITVYGTTVLSSIISAWQQDGVGFAGVFDAVAMEVDAACGYALRSDNTLISFGDNYYRNSPTASRGFGEGNLVKVEDYDDCYLGLFDNGYVRWTDLIVDKQDTQVVHTDAVDIAIGYYSYKNTPVVVRSDGGVDVTISTTEGDLIAASVSGITDAVKVAAGKGYLAVLHATGRVSMHGVDTYGTFAEVEAWTDIIQIFGERTYVIGVDATLTAYTAGNFAYGPQGETDVVGVSTYADSCMCMYPNGSVKVFGPYHGTVIEYVGNFMRSIVQIHRDYDRAVMMDDAGHLIKYTYHAEAAEATNLQGITVTPTGTVQAPEVPISALPDTPSPHGPRGYVIGGDDVGFRNDYTDLIQIIDIATPGNTGYFGSLIYARSEAVAASNGHRAVFNTGEGYGPTWNRTVFDYIQLGTPALAAIYGDSGLSVAWAQGSSVGDVALFVGGYDTDTWDSIRTIFQCQLSTPGTVASYSDLSKELEEGTATSDNSRIYLIGGYETLDYNYAMGVTVLDPIQQTEANDFATFTVSLGGNMSAASTSGRNRWWL